MVIRPIFRASDNSEERNFPRGVINRGGSAEGGYEKIIINKGNLGRGGGEGWNKYGSGNYT